MQPYNIYGSVIEFKSGFGRVFVHVDLAPKHKDRHRIDALEAAIRNLSVQPAHGEERTLPIGYPVDIVHPKTKKRTTFNSLRVRFEELQSVPEDIMDSCFQYQKGSVTPSDVYLSYVAFVQS